MQEQFSASDEAISMVVAEELDLGKQVIEVAAVASLPRNDDTIAVTSALQ